MQMTAICIDSRDNVAVVAQNVKAGDEITIVPSSVTVKVNEDIPLGHKVALKGINRDAMIIKYGIPIGRATVNITAGSWVHIHNVKDITSELCHKYTVEYRAKGGKN